MKFTSAKSLIVLTALVCSCALSSQAQQATPGGAGSQGNLAIEGSWRVTVQLKRCDNGNPIGDPFQSLVSLIRGGTQVETTANASFYPDERGPGHGNWRPLGPYTYSADSEAFITSSGQLSKVQTISQQIQYDSAHDTWTSNAVVQFFNPSGQLLGKACAGAGAIRFP